MTAGPGQEHSSAPSPSGDLSTGPSRALPRRRGYQEGCLLFLQRPHNPLALDTRVGWALGTVASGVLELGVF